MIRLLLIISILFVSALAMGQKDSMVYHQDSVVVDTLFVTDTVITVDTILVWGVLEDEVQRDTIRLTSMDQSWSKIKEDTILIDDIVMRRDSGMMLLSAKIGFSDDNTSFEKSGYSLHTLPPMAFQVEYYHNDFFSYGGQIVANRNKLVNDTLSSQFEKNGTFGLAAIGTFHYSAWLQDVTHNKLRFGYLDLYASLAIRMDIHRDVIAEPWDETDQQFRSGEKEKDAYVKMRLRPIFGARYYISDRFSINIEFGKGNLGTLTSSVSWLISKP